ncbi:nuclear transport factor 2 family protein [Thalassotalea fusca]
MRAIYIVLFTVFFYALPAAASGQETKNEKAIKRAVLDYIEAQHHTDPTLFKRGVDEKLAKRTYWRTSSGKETVLETSFETMIEVAKTYNQHGDKFPKQPRVDVDILDIDNRVASVKLTVDEWIDYMHLYQTQQGDWKIVNVLWQYHDQNKHQSQK